jgi:Tol biopolymer transport system component
MNSAGNAALAAVLLAASAAAQGTARVSVDSSGVEGDSYSTYASISSDGTIVVFSSRAANLISNDTNGCEDVFLHDRSTGAAERVSVDSSGVEGNGDSGLFQSSVSADGLVIAFESFASNLVSGDTNGFGASSFTIERRESRNS